MDNENWRFEPDTYLVQAMLDHYDTPTRKCMHNDEYVCANAMLKWLEDRNVRLVQDAGS